MSVPVKFTSAQTELLLTTAYNYDPKRGNVYDREILATKWIQHWLHLIAIKQGLKKLRGEDECFPLEVTPCVYPPPDFEGNHDKEVKKEEERKRLIHEKDEKEKLDPSLASLVPVSNPPATPPTSENIFDLDFPPTEGQTIPDFSVSLSLPEVNVSPLNVNASKGSSKQKEIPSKNALDHLEYLLEGFGRFRFDFVYLKNKRTLFDSHVFQACYVLSSSPLFKIENPSSVVSEDMQQKNLSSNFLTGLLSPQQSRFCDTFVAVVASVAPTLSKEVTEEELIGWLHWIHDVDDAQTDLQVQTDKPREDKLLEGSPHVPTFENSFRKIGSEYSNLDSIEKSFQKEKEIQSKIQTPDFYGQLENEKQKEKEEDTKRSLLEKRSSKRNRLLESFLGKEVNENALLVRTITKAKLANTFVHSRICPHFSLFYNLFVCSSSPRKEKNDSGQRQKDASSSSSWPWRVFYFSEYIPNSLASWLTEKEDMIQVAEITSILFLFTFSVYTLLLAGYEFSWFDDEYKRGRFQKRRISSSVREEIEAWILENWRYHSIEKGGGWHYVIPLPSSVDFPNSFKKTTSFSVREGETGRKKGISLRSGQKQKKPWQKFEPLLPTEMKESTSLVTTRLVPNLGATWVFASLDLFQNQVQNYKEEKKFKVLSASLDNLTLNFDTDLVEHKQEQSFRPGYSTDSSAEEEEEDYLQSKGNFHEIEAPVQEQESFEVGNTFGSSQRQQPVKAFQHFMLVLSLISIFKKKLNFFLLKTNERIKNLKQNSGPEIEIEIEKKRENEKSFAFLELCEYTLQQEDLLETATSDLLTKITARLAPTTVEPETIHGPTSSSSSSSSSSFSFSSRLTIASKLVINLCGHIESYWKFLLSDVFQELNPEREKEEAARNKKKKAKKETLFSKAGQKEKDISPLNVLRPVFNSIQEMLAFDGMKKEKKTICEQWGKAFCSSLSTAPVSQDTEWYQNEMEFNVSKQYFQYNPLAIYQWSQANPLFLDFLTPFFGFWSAKQKIFDRLLGSPSWNDLHQFDDEEFLLELGATQEEHFPSVLLLQQLEEEEPDVQLRLTKKADRIVPFLLSSSTGSSIAKDQEKARRVRFFLQNIRSPYFGMFVDAIAKAQQVQKSDTNNAWDVLERAGHALFALVPQLESRGKQAPRSAFSELTALAANQTAPSSLGTQLNMIVEGKDRTSAEKEDFFNKREEQRKKEISVWESNAWMPLIPFSGPLHSPKDRFLLNSSFSELSDYFATLEAEVLSQNFTLSSRKLVDGNSLGGLPLKQKYKQVLLIFEQYPNMWERVKNKLNMEAFLEFDINDLGRKINAEKKIYLEELSPESSDRNIEKEMENKVLHWLTKPGDQSIKWTSDSRTIIPPVYEQGIIPKAAYEENIKEASLPYQLYIPEDQITELNQLKEKLTTGTNVTIEQQVEIFITFINTMPPFVISLIVRKIRNFSKKQKNTNGLELESEDSDMDDEFWALQRFKEIFDLQKALEHFALQTLKQELIHKSRLDFF